MTRKKSDYFQSFEYVEENAYSAGQRKLLNTQKVCGLKKKEFWLLRYERERQKTNRT
jgi:hypothetical protein